jgi:hypothetical protein
VLKVNENINFDPIRALYNKNVEIQEEFFKRFDRKLEIDDQIASLDVDMSTYDAIFIRG